LRPRRPSPAMIVALIALVVALSGTAVAASRYLITSTTQIKPSVRRDLRAEASATAVKAAKRGAHSIVLRVHSVAPVALTEEEHPVPLSSPLSWTQGAEEVDEVVGVASVTLANSCPNSTVEIEASIDGEGHGNLPLFSGGPGTFAVQLQWPERHVPLFVLNEPGKLVTHALQVITRGTTCPGATLDSVSFDVIGAR
jgi:hypothetical protein